MFASALGTLLSKITFNVVPSGLSDQAELLLSVETADLGTIVYLTKATPVPPALSRTEPRIVTKEEIH